MHLAKFRRRGNRDRTDEFRFGFALIRRRPSSERYGRLLGDVARWPLRHLDINIEQTSAHQKPRESRSGLVRDRFPSLAACV